MKTKKTHIGMKVKEILHTMNLSDYRIIKQTGINQAYLSKIYTSRDVQPWKLKRFLYKLNREFDLELTTENLYEA